MEQIKWYIIKSNDAESYLAGMMDDTNELVYTSIMEEAQKFDNLENAETIAEIVNGTIEEIIWYTPTRPIEWAEVKLHELS